MTYNARSRRLVFTPARELVHLRTNLTSQVTQPTATNVVLNSSGASDSELWLERPKAPAVLHMGIGDINLTANFSRGSAAVCHGCAKCETQCEQAPLYPTDRLVHIRVLIDRDITEIFFAGGRAVLTIEQKGRSSHIEIGASAAVRLVNASSWQMGSIHTTTDAVLRAMRRPSKSDDGTCATGEMTPDLDRCPGGPPGYHTAQVASGAAAAAECAKLCCADPQCEVWVTRQLSVASGNCSAGASCCWLKPSCAGTLASPGTTSGTVLRRDPRFHFIDTAGWVGTEYTPARAANSLWWARFPEYAADIDRELAAARKMLGLRVLRIFLHTLAFEHVGAATHAEYVQRFLAIAEKHGMGVGIVLFGDGWNHGHGLPHAGNTGANASCVLDECCPRAADGSVGVKGCHNGCWFANPQDHQRGDPPASFDGQGGWSVSGLTAAFKPYVEAVVRPLAQDKRVVWWEAYNEPCAWRHYEARICTAFEVLTSTAIKELAYGWAKALHPIQPVISNWNTANNTFSDIIDIHLYSSDFVAWSEAVFAECPPHATNASLCNRGAVVTEAGARWFEGMLADAGSPLTVLHYLSALRETGAPFVPGVALAWELMVGNSNTRWSNGPPCVTPTALTKEPPIPWCGLLWPDGTPVSYTEAAATRRYLSGSSDFLMFEDFLPPRVAALPADVVLNLTAGAAGFSGAFNQTEHGAMVEASVWLGDEAATMTLSVGDAGANGAGWQVQLTHAKLDVLRVARAGAAGKVVGTLPASSLSCGIPVGAWNILRLVLRPATAESHEETLGLFLNPTAHAATPSLGAVTPRLTVTQASAGAPAGRRAVGIAPPPEGFVLVDYISALEPGGGPNET
eukprot:COSAG04_NODE_438_length_14426_cov_10.589795_9_plen_853_part_00